MDKLGVFLCTGCGIGEAIDVDEVIEAANDHGCACTLTHECFCAPEGLEAIKNTVAENELDGILVAACSDRVKTKEFNALTVDGPSMVRMAIREHCAWPLKNAEEDEDKTACAQDMVKMGLPASTASRPSSR
jgi:quinone-modifying oxidoreductase subunit QmoB